MKTLEEKGIGRPSTYASIINTIQERDYVKKIKARLVPTEIGMVVTELLVKNFPYIFKAGVHGGAGERAGRGGRGNGEVDGPAERLLRPSRGRAEGRRARRWKTSRRWSRRRTRSATSAELRWYLKWGKFGSFYSCANFTKEKPISVSAGAVEEERARGAEEGHDEVPPSRR